MCILTSQWVILNGQNHLIQHLTMFFSRFSITNRKIEKQKNEKCNFCPFLRIFAHFFICDGKHVKPLKKMLLTSERHAKHPFIHWSKYCLLFVRNTQQRSYKRMVTRKDGPLRTHNFFFFFFFFFFCKWFMPDVEQHGDKNWNIVCVLIKWSWSYHWKSNVMFNE